MKRLWRWIEQILWTGRDIERPPSFNFNPGPEVPYEPKSPARPGDPKILK